MNPPGLGGNLLLAALRSFLQLFDAACNGVTIIWKQSTRREFPYQSHGQIPPACGRPHRCEQRRPFIETPVIQEQGFAAQEVLDNRGRYRALTARDRSLSETQPACW